MRIAFYAPMKSPTHAVPSGDRRVGRLFIDALEAAGHEVSIASTLRTYEPEGNAERQMHLRSEGMAAAADLLSCWGSASGAPIPDLWFTYHVYYKAPDWLGPTVSTALGIPYVIAEASYAPKRASGAWAIGHAAAGHAIRAASLVLCPTKGDVECVRPLVAPGGTVVWLPPFIDASPYQAAAKDRIANRARLAAQQGLDPSIPWVAVVAMMRPGDKSASYQMIAKAFGTMTDLRWQAVVAGDGAERAAIEQAMEGAAPGRFRFLGEQGPEEVAAIYAACDLCMWPAVNEAYGMAMLEAQAAGIPVVSRRIRGVPDVVCDGVTGLLASPEDERSFAQIARELLTDPARRSSMGAAAARFAGTERSLETTAARLRELLEPLSTTGVRPPAAMRR